jgi:hypothetical protein
VINRHPFAIFATSRDTGLGQGKGKFHAKTRSREVELLTCDLRGVYRRHANCRTALPAPAPLGGKSSGDRWFGPSQIGRGKAQKAQISRAIRE